MYTAAWYDRGGWSVFFLISPPLGPYPGGSAVQTSAELTVDGPFEPQGDIPAPDRGRPLHGYATRLAGSAAEVQGRPISRGGGEQAETAAKYS